MRPAATAIALACVVLAGLSLLVPSAPTTDPWGWIVWGREVLHFDLSTVVPGSPSWKPLPVFVTTPLALAGGAAPALWLLVSRAGGLASLVVAYRLADRLAGRWAGLLTVAGLLLSTEWVRSLAHGYTEPLAIGLLLAAVDQHLSGRPRWAFLLGALVALTRPEAWALLVIYGVVLWRRHQASPLLLAAVAASVPSLWLFPDWIGSGDPFHASAVSREVVPTGTHAALVALGEAALIVPLPLSVTGLVGTVIAFRRGDRRIHGIAALVVSWTALLAVLMFAGYPASSRFFALPAGLTCVVGAVGAVCIVRLASRRSLRAALAVVLALAVAHSVALRAAAAAEEGREAVRRAQLEADLKTMVERKRGELRRCGKLVLPKELVWTKGAIAWELGLPMRRVRAITTSASGYLLRLSDGRPRGRAVRAVTVYPHLLRFVSLSPFANARIRVGLHPRMPLATLAGVGLWRIDVPGRERGC